MGAYVLGRSSWGRVGLIVATAVMVQPGYTGTLTLELVNEGTARSGCTQGSESRGWQSTRFLGRHTGRTLEPARSTSLQQDQSPRV